MTITRRWSYSALEDYSQCPEKYRQRRIERVPEVPSMAAVGGRAFHKVTELYDLSGEWPSWPEWLDVAAGESEESEGIPRERFRVSGRKTKDRPDGEDYAYWRDVLGPELIQGYQAWRETTPWMIARDLPTDANGRIVGIEYEITYTIDGIEQKSYIDRIMVDEFGNLGVVDLKTWSRRRDGLQLPVYLFGLRQWGVNAWWGAYFEARKGTATAPAFYDSWNESKLAGVYRPAAEAEAAGLYPPRPGEGCSWCAVRDHCRFSIA